MLHIKKAHADQVCAGFCLIGQSALAEHSSAFQHPVEGQDGDGCGGWDHDHLVIPIFVAEPEAHSKETDCDHGKLAEFHTDVKRDEGWDELT